MPEPTLLDVRRAIATLRALGETRAHIDALDPSVRIDLKDAATNALGAPVRVHRRARIRVPAQAKEKVRALRLTCSICRNRFAVPDGVDANSTPRMCAACRAAEEERKHELADVRLDGRVALVTGARIRLGHRVALGLLRAGARVVATSRFPHIAKRRFIEALASEPGAIDRLSVVELDMRKLDDVERFARKLDNDLPHLDIVVHNAAQTVRRPPEQYAPLVAAERALARLPAAAFATANDPLPAGLDAEGEPIDDRVNNSWTTTIDDVDAGELVEVLVANAAAPFVLTRALLPLLTRAPNARRAVICVTSREGRFHVEDKLPRHPHTNMAKAALNMMVRTCGPGLVDAGISLVAVDPGWFSEQRAQAETRALPLSLDDAAARVLAGIVRGLDASAAPLPGTLLKDFRVAAW